MPDQSELEFQSRVNPEMGITPEATRKHGITDAAVLESPKFSEIADKLATFLKGCDLAGYNLLSFDLPMLKAEFERIGHSFSTEGRRNVDVLDIYVHKEPRDLRSAYRFYCGREFRDAHSASADARACLDVLKGQLRKYEDLPRTTEGLATLVEEHRKLRTLDSGGWFGGTAASAAW